MKRSSLTLLALLLGILLSPAARAGSISGRVLDPSGRPVTGARVRWLAYRDADHLLLDQTKGTDPAPLGETKTDAQGRFRVTLEKPGLSVSLSVVPDGLPSARLEGPFESADDADLFDIQIPPGSKATGQVVDEAGKPIAGARILAVEVEGVFESDVRFFSETRALADGSFSMIDAPFGARSLVVSLPGFVRVSHLQIEPRGQERIVLRRGGTIKGVVRDATGKPVAGAIVASGEVASETDAAGRYRISDVGPGSQSVQTIWNEDLASRADGVRVKKGEETEVTLKLARAAAVSGTVVEEKTKKPIAGAQISASTAAAGGFGRRTSERAVHTDTRGRFRLGGLASRPYLVEASKDGYLPASIPNVTPGKSVAMNLALRRAASIAGKIVDEKGMPVMGARIGLAQEFNARTFRARGLAAAAAAFLGRGSLTGPEGTFRLRNVVPARSLELEASKTGYATAHQPGITLRPGDALQGLSLVLRTGLRARGRVVDGKGEPVAGAELRLAIREGGARGMRAQFRLMAMDRQKPDAVSGADGSFVVGGLSPGQYAASVSREGFAAKNVPSLEVKANGENVWPPFTLAPGIALTGSVRDSAGQAIAGAQILAIDPGAGSRPLDAASGPDGRFRLDGLTADRPLMLNVSADGYASVQKDVTPPAQDVAITLKSAGTIRGHVEDSDTKTPITDFTVGARGSTGFFMIQAGRGGAGGDKSIHSDEGVFELSNVAPGKWTVHVSAAGYRPGDIAGVEVGEGATKEGVVLSLKRGGALSGRVLDPQLSTGVANASVSYQTAGSAGGGMGGAFARMAGNNAGNTTSTDADGRFSFEGIAEGKIMVTASHPDYLDVTQEVDTSKQSSIDLTLQTGGSIAGTVVGQDGRSPIPGSQVSLNQEGDTQFGFGSDSTRTDGSGNFLFEHLQAGRFRLVAQSSDGKTTSQEAVLSNGQRLTGILLQMASGTLLIGTVSGLPAGRLGGVRISANGQNYNDSTSTDDSGKFTLQNVPAGVVHVSANTSFLSGRSTSKSVEIPDGAPQFTVDIEFQGASRLAGRVTRGDTALTGVFVNAFPLAPASGAGRASAQTDDNGQYALEGLSDGDYTVSLSGQSVSYRKNFAVSGDTPGDIQLPPIQLTGMVTEAGSGEPLDGATIQTQLQTSADQATGRGLGMKTATGDSTGRYFIDDVDPGTYQVTAHRDGYQARTETLTIGGDSASLDFPLQRGEGISIRVSDGLTGLPLKGVIVSALDAGGAVAYQGAVTLDSTGKGEINSLAPGRYAVHFFSDGYASKTAVVDAPSPLVSILLTPGGRVEVVTSVPLTGRILDGTGLPYQLGPWRSDGRVAGAPPLVSWDHFAPGSYQLLVGPAGAEVPYPFTVAEGQTTRVEIK